MGDGEKLELLDIARREKWHVLGVLLNSICLFGFDVNRVNEESDGRGLVHILAEKNEKLLELLLEKALVDSTRPKIDLNLADRGGKTGLHLSVESGNVRAVRALVKAAADLNVKDAARETPLLAAVRTGNLDVARFLLEAGAFVGATNGEGCSALHLSCQSDDRLEITRLLLKNNAKLDLYDDLGRTPVHVAMISGSCDTVRFLLENGVHMEPNFAVYANRIDVVRVLLEKAAHVSLVMRFKDRHGYTPLHAAVFVGSLEMAQFLLDAGARVDEVDHDDYTPLHVAAALSIPEATPLIALLLSKGASIDARTFNGDTPLHRAACVGNLKAVAHLLKQSPRHAGAFNKDSRTPSDLARENGYEKVVDYLETIAAIRTAKRRIRRKTDSYC